MSELQLIECLYAGKNTRVYYIVAYVSLDETIMSYFGKRFGTLQKPHITLIAIHVRRGDILYETANMNGAQGACSTKRRYHRINRIKK